MKKLLLVFFLISFAFSIKAMASIRCETVMLDKSMSEQDEINDSIENLARLNIQLEQIKILGKTPLSATALKHDYQKKEDELIQYFENNHIMTREKFREKMRQFSVKLQKIEEKNPEEDRKRAEMKEFLSVETQGSQMRFYDITPGKFLMSDKKILTEIKEPFAMMATHVTQLMWAQILAESGSRDLDTLNPTFSKTAQDSTSIDVNGVMVPMYPENPVVNIKFKDIKSFLDKLNRLSESEDSKKQNFLRQLIPGHQKGDLYDLPSSSQWEFVITDRGEARGKYFDRDDSSEITQHEWVHENSGDRTHPVAQLKPRLIEGHEFFDLNGNASIMTKDSVLGQRSSEVQYIVRGNHCGLPAFLSDQFFQSAIFSVHKSVNVGIRLIRTRPHS